MAFSKRKMYIILNEEPNFALLSLISLRPKNTLEKCTLLFEHEQHVRSIYSQEWMDKYSNYDFFILFRMGKETFEKLSQVVQCPILNKPFQGGGVPLTCEKALLIVLWWLGKGDALNSIGDRFDVAQSTVHNYANLVLNRLVELILKFIQWPNMDEMTTIEMKFREICGYPGKYFIVIL